MDKQHFGRYKQDKCHVTLSFNALDVFEPHTQAITKSIWDEKRQVLFTASKDKSIKIWLIPSEWHVYFAKKEEKKEIPPPMSSAPVEKAKQERKNSGEESDGDDDLKGWASK